MSRAIVGTNDGNVQMGFNLGQGVANSATWVDVTGGNTVLPNRPILDVYQDTANPLIGYAAVGGFDQNTPGTPGHVFQVTCTANCASFTWADKSGTCNSGRSIMVDRYLQVFAAPMGSLLHQRHHAGDAGVVSPAGRPAQRDDLGHDMDGGATTWQFNLQPRLCLALARLPHLPRLQRRRHHRQAGHRQHRHAQETTASPGWDNKYDRDGDGDVDIVDIMMVATPSAIAAKRNDTLTTKHPGIWPGCLLLSRIVTTETAANVKAIGKVANSTR
ncbi:MAG: hypothetical protein R2844_17900 [Caldilineales bacterium]